MEQIWLVLEYLTTLPTTALVVAVIGLLTLYYWPIWSSHRYPPGPTPWPFLGNIPIYLWHYRNISKYFCDNRDTLGDVFTLWLSGPMVILNSTEAIYEGFVKNADSLSNRPQQQNDVIKDLGIIDGGGVVDSPDGIWQIHRRHLLTVFKEQGIGKAKMENVITEEIKYFHEALEDHKGQAIDIREQLRQSVSNIATYIAFGTRFEYDAEQLSNLQVDEFFAIFFETFAAPVLRYLPFDPMGFQAAKQKVMKTMSFIREQIAEHEKTIDFDNPRDFIDSFLVQRKKNEGSEVNPFTDDHLISTLLQIYVAGTDTTSTVLYWTFLYLVVYPDIQERIYQEIKEHISDRSPMYSDGNNMPYTMSVITELLRIDVAATSLFHYTSQDVTIQGHMIPKGTMVLANLWINSHDDQLYNSPMDFQPDRFIDSDGNFCKPEAKKFTPFSIGKRVCPGEQLARMELFLFLTCTLQRYKVLLGQDNLPSTEGVIKFVVVPKERYKIRFVERS